MSCPTAHKKLIIGITNYITKIKCNQNMTFFYILVMELDRTRLDEDFFFLKVN